MFPEQTNLSFAKKNEEPVVWMLWDGTPLFHVIPWSPSVLIITSFAGFVYIFKTSSGGYYCATTTRLIKLNTQFYKTRQHMKYIYSNTEKEIGYIENKESWVGKQNKK